MKMNEIIFSGWKGEGKFFLGFVELLVEEFRKRKIFFFVNFMANFVVFL